MSDRFKIAIQILSLAAFYMVAGKVGLLVATAGGDHATLIWPPTGIALAGLFLMGFRVWPAITIGAFTLNVLSQMPLIATISVAIGNTLEPVAAVWLLHRIGWQAKGLNSPSGVIKFALVGALLPSILAATTGTLSLWGTGVTQTHEFSTTFLTWWLGDAMGVLMVAPLVISWVSAKSWRWDYKQSVEMVILFAVLLAVCFITFGLGLGSSVHHALLVFVVFPLLVFIAMRYGIRGAALAALILSISAATGMAAGIGPFIQLDIHESIDQTWAFMSIAGLTTLILGASITERKNSEEALRFTQFVMDNAGDAVFVANKDGRFINVNNTACSELEYTRNELLSMHVANIAPEYTPESWPLMWERVRKEKQVLVQTVHRTKSGRDYPVEIMAQYNVHDGQECICGFVRDITQRVTDRAALRESEERFRRFAECTDQVLWFTAVQPERILYVSPAFERIWQRTSQEIYENPQVWSDCIHEDDRRRIKDQYEGWLEGRQPSYETEYRIVRTDGSVRWILDHGTLIRNDAGDIEQACGIATDITKRKETEDALKKSEERLQRVADTIPGAVYQYRLTPEGDDSFLYCSQGIQVLFGYTAQQLLNDFSLAWGAIAPEDVEAMHQSVLRSAESMAPWKHEFRVLKKDGRVTWVHGESIPIYNEDDGSIVWSGILIDITDRKLTEQKLQESHDLLAAIMEGTTDVVYLKDPEGRYLMVNHVCSDFTGIPTAEFIGRDDIQVFGPVSGRELMDTDREIISSGKTKIFEEEIENPQTHQKHTFSSSKSPLRDTQGKIVGLIGISRDITKHKQAEQTTREQARLLDQIFEHSLDSIVVLDKDYNFIRVSKTYARSCQKDSSEFPGRNHFEMYPSDLKDEVYPYKEAKRIYRRHSRPFVFPDHPEWGTTYWDLGLVPILGADQEIELFLFTLKDVTEQQRTEIRLRQEKEFTDTALDAQIDTFFLFEPATGKAIRWNRAFRNISGYTDEEIARLPAPDSYYGPEDLDCAKAFMERVLEEHVGTIELELICKDGRKVPTEYRVSVIFDGERNPRYIVSVGRDLTARKQAEQERARLEVELRQSQKMEAIGTLASGVAHDFNNLLAAIYGHVELLRKKLPNDHPDQDHLEIIDRASKQGTNVTRSLLTFSHKAPSNKEPVELSGLIQESLRILRRLLPTSIEVVKELPEDASVWVKIDATQMQQVLMNLVVNARDAMVENGELRIGLRTESYETPHRTELDQKTSPGHAVLVVEDTGRGMDQDTLEHIFEPFFTTKSREHGTGLGLSVVHGIVTDHGGKISVESQPGRGARISVRLPMCDLPQEHSHSKTKKESSSCGGAQILLAEDNEFVRNVISDSLESEGYDVVIAVDGLDAMKAFHAKKNTISLAILDNEMPKESGQSCLETMKTQREDMPVIMISGNVGNLINRSRGNKNISVLAKPFKMAELIDTINQLLGEPL